MAGWWGGVVGVKTFFGSHSSRRRAFGSPLHFLCAADVGQGRRRERERARGGRRGGEFSREQHFPTVWGFDTWLSHIPQPVADGA